MHPPRLFTISLSITRQLRKREGLEVTPPGRKSSAWKCRRATRHKASIFDEFLINFAGAIVAASEISSSPSLPSHPPPSPYSPSRALSAPLYSLYRRHSRQAALVDSILDARRRSLSPPSPPPLPSPSPRCLCSGCDSANVGTFWN